MKLKNLRPLIDQLIEEKELSRNELVLVCDELVIIKTSNPEILEALDFSGVKFNIYDNNSPTEDVQVTILIALEA